MAGPQQHAHRAVRFGRQVQRRGALSIRRYRQGADAAGGPGNRLEGERRQARSLNRRCSIAFALAAQPQRRRSRRAEIQDPEWTRDFSRNRSACAWPIEYAPSVRFGEERQIAHDDQVHEGPGGHVPARAGAGESSHPGTLPRRDGLGTMSSQQARARVPANVLLFGPRALYRLGWLYAVNASRRHCATSVTPGLARHGTHRTGDCPHGSGELSHFCATVPNTTLFHPPSVGVHVGVMTAY